MNGAESWPPGLTCRGLNAVAPSVTFSRKGASQAHMQAALSQRLLRPEGTSTLPGATEESRPCGAAAIDLALHEAVDGLHRWRIPPAPQCVVRVGGDDHAHFTISVGGEVPDAINTSLARESTERLLLARHRDVLEDHRQVVPHLPEEDGEGLCVGLPENPNLTVDLPLRAHVLFLHSIPARAASTGLPTAVRRRDGALRKSHRATRIALVELRRRRRRLQHDCGSAGGVGTAAAAVWGEICRDDQG
mmetsp:Transcript_76162/g.205447  ORF Transcript_76162/g.205447 Transcript_76162/m.205447 type:complete len:247 (-) Transcript_76162:250-990(-)